MNDASSFGGFINSFIASLRDESVKIPCLVIPLLSDAVSRHRDTYDVSHYLTTCNCSLTTNDFQNKGTREVINDALYLRSLHELSSMSIPIQSPSAWPAETWSKFSATDV